MFIISAKIFCAEPIENFFEFTLPNGMGVFVFEDFSTPIVRAEFCAKAGYEIRNECDSPYFILCAELLPEAEFSSQENRQILSSLESECGANIARFSIDCTSAETKEIFEQIAERAFAPLFSDEILQEKFQKIKGLEISPEENFINSQINSRVFEDFSLRGENSPYPPFSAQKNLSELRTVVSEIFQEYYVPQNCAIFVSGAINAKSVFHIARQTFGKYSGRPHATETSFFVAEKNSKIHASENSNESFSRAGKKVVLCDKEFSSEFAQVVAQFSPLEKYKSKIAAAIFESKNSALKNSLVQNDALAIRGSDYVNAAAATKKNLSRIVLQMLFEKSNVEASKQIEIFEEILGREICDFSEEEFIAAKKILIQDFCDSISNPKSFMENLSRFWAEEIFEEKNHGGTLIERFLSIPKKIEAENFADLKSALEKSEPWIFVLLNENVLSPIQNEFEKSGYEIVAKKNDDGKKQNAEIAMPFSTQEISLESEIPIYNANFVAKSRASMKSVSLSNKIQVTLKENPSSNKTAVALYVFGGEVFDAEEKYGMQSVLAAILERNISDLLEMKFALGEISRSAKVQLSVSDVDFLITVECNSGEEKVALRCIGDALLFADFAPAQVDMALNARRTRQILQAGSIARQMYCAGVKFFYKSAAYRSLYSTQKEILENLKYSDALESYQKILDASRIEIIAAGNFGGNSEKEFFEECEKIFGGLKKSMGKRKFLSEPNKVSKRSLAVKLEHTFLTDISADKAGPRPAVLVPTTDFYDSVQFWIRSPKNLEDDAAIFDALLLQLEAQCKKIASQNFKGIEVRVEKQSALVSFAALTFFNVKKISDADFILQNALVRLRENIFENSELIAKDEKVFPEEKFFNGMKSRWIKTRYRGSHENADAIARIARETSATRLSNGGQTKPSDFFVREYEIVALCENEKFREIWEKYFTETPFKIFSLDSKK